MKLVDEQVLKRRTKKIKIGKGKYETKVEPGPTPQVALVAMNPHTGEILALVGGRNYAFSQLNHAMAKRPTGSIFKPFVYAAAMNTALDGSQAVLTPLRWSMIQPSTFAYGDQIYEPRNYKEEYHGPVTARYALAMSLNNATVKFAEEVGYDKVAHWPKLQASPPSKPLRPWRSAHMTPPRSTWPRAYTVFANGGLRISPTMINSVRNAEGDMVVDFKPETPAGPRLPGGRRNHQPDGGRYQQRIGRGPSVDAASMLPQPAKPAAPTTAGSLDIPRTCYAWCGLATTITAIFT